MPAPPQLQSVIAAQPYPLLFVTISGAHLYGFPSADSDYDLRGVHVLPLREVIGLTPPPETIECTTGPAGVDLDLVTHDVRKFFRLLLRPNGYVLEQLYSPLVLHTTPVHDELKAIARGCVTKQHALHYLGFARTQWRLVEQHRRLKPLLYTYRVLLAGLHLMRTGEIEANLPRLNEAHRLPHVDDLIARKTAGGEHDPLADTDLAFHEHEYRRLTATLEAASATSPLPPDPTAAPALNDLLLRLRLSSTEPRP
ncbi:MAG: nucleotidyltransferase domain-containing protein [Phycisphaerae bacterium]|jgi:predicted nucleotidyltransferase